MNKYLWNVKLSTVFVSLDWLVLLMKGSAINTFLVLLNDRNFSAKVDDW